MLVDNFFTGCFVAVSADTTKVTVTMSLPVSLPHCQYEVACLLSACNAGVLPGGDPCVAFVIV